MSESTFAVDWSSRTIRLFQRSPVNLITKADLPTPAPRLPESAQMCVDDQDRPITSAKRVGESWELFVGDESVGKLGFTSAKVQVIVHRPGWVSIEVA